MNWLRSIVLLGTTVFMSGCTSRSPLLSSPGITHVGPTDHGLSSPLWSPDGKAVAVTHATNVHSWTSEILVVDLGTNVARPVEATEYGNLQARSWSPSSSQIAFSSMAGGEWPQAIWLADALHAREPAYLAKGDDASWAKDGQRIAILSGTLVAGRQVQTISILDLVTKSQENVFSADATYSAAFGLAWSPDGSSIVYSLAQQQEDVTPRFEHADLYVLDLQTGTTKKITDRGVNTNPRWSPDGRLISYITHTAGDLDFTLMIGNADGSCTERVISRAYSADWSPDGRHLAFDYAGNIYILDLAPYFGSRFASIDDLCP
jgi:Tol biopolymer transport system component